MIFFTITSTSIALAIALIALKECQELRQRVEDAEGIAAAALAEAQQPPVIHYHAPRPEPKALRLPDFIEQMEARSHVN